MPLRQDMRFPAKRYTFIVTPLMSFAVAKQTMLRFALRKYIPLLCSVAFITPCPCSKKVRCLALIALGRSSFFH